MITQECKKIYLCTPALEILTVLNGVRTETVQCNRQIKDFSTLNFDVDKYIVVDGEQILSNGYDDLDIYMYLYLEDVGYFQMQYPPTQNDGNQEYKSIQAYSIEKEFEDMNWINFQCNTGLDGSLERLIDGNVDGAGFTIDHIVFFNPDKPEFSFLHIILTKMPGWTIQSSEIDVMLWNKKVYIEKTNSNLYNLLTSVVAPQIECIFIFDILNRRIRAVSVENLDDHIYNTNIFIGFRNLANSIDVNVDEESVFTSINCSGGDDLNINACNYGKSSLVNLDYFKRYPYMTDSLIEKINNWETWCNDHREEYMNLNKELVAKQEKMNTLYYKVPSDGTNWQQWDNMKEELLNQNMDYYNALLTSLQVSVDTNPQYVTDENGKQIYVPWKKIDGSVDHDTYLEKLYNLENGYGGHYTYLEIIKYILPNIQIAIDNLGKTTDEKKDYVKEYETNWELYGIKELEAKKQEYEKKLYSLKGYEKDWGDMTAEEKAAFTGGQAQYDTTKHNSYVEYSNLVGSESTPDTLLYQLKKLNNEYDVLSYDAQILNTAILSMHQQAEISDKKFGLSNKELLVFYRLLINTDYQNDNIKPTSVDTASTQIDIAKELFDDCVSKLSELAQPQISFSTAMDNLLNLEEFQAWHDDFQLLNFIHLGIRDDYSVKLRLIGYTYNPCEITNDLSVEFSNVITSQDGRSDHTCLLNKENNRGSKNSISIGKGNSNTEKEYVTALLQLMTQNNLFRSSVCDIADVAAVKDLQVYHLTGDNVVFDESVIKYLIAANIAVADLRVGDITISNGMRILSANGRMIMNGKALQIIKTDSNGNNYVGLQLGYDTTDNPSLILRNEQGETVLTPQGITKDAVAEKLIDHNMLNDLAVHNNNINWSDISDGVVDGKPTWDIASIYKGNEKFAAIYESFSTSVTANLETLSNTTTEVSSKVDNLNKTVESKVSQTDIDYTIANLNVGGKELFDYSKLKSYKLGSSSGSLNTATGFTIDKDIITVSSNPSDYIGIEINTSNIKYIGSGKAELFIYGYFERDDDAANKTDDVYVYYDCFKEDGTHIQVTAFKKMDVNESSNMFAEIITLPADTYKAYIGIGQEWKEDAVPYRMKSISIKDAALYDITRDIRDRLSQIVVSRDAISLQVSDMGSTIGNVGDKTSQSTLYGKLAKIQMQVDAIALAVVNDEKVTSLTITDGMIEAITDKFVIKDTAGSSTIIQGGKITTNNIVGTNGTINLGLGTFNYGNGKLSWDGSNLSVTGAITATSLTLGETAKVPANSITGLSTVATSGKYEDLEGRITNVTQLTGGINILYSTDVTVGEGVTENGLTIRTITVGSKKFNLIDDGDFILLGNSYEGTAEDGSKNFTVIEKNGALTAKNAVIYGTIYATNGEFFGKIESSTGKIGGFTITDSAIYNGTDSLTSTAEGVYLGINGIRNYKSETAYTNIQDGVITAHGANIEGNITASNGKIGGYNIYSNRILSVDSSETKACWLATYDYTSSDESSVHQAFSVQTKNSTTGKWVDRFSVRYDGSMVSKSEDNNIEMKIESGSITSCNNINASGTISTSGAIKSNGHKLSHRILVDNNDKYGVGMAQTTPIFIPMVDGTGSNGEIKLGSNSNKFAEIWSVQALNTTSDKNLKENISPFDSRYENAYLDFKPCIFMYKNFSPTDNHDRKHFGLIAQEVEETLHKHGISNEEAAFLCIDNLTEPNKAGELIEYSMRYGELPALNMHMIQKSYARISDLEKIVFEQREEIKALKDEIQSLKTS